MEADGVALVEREREEQAIHDLLDEAAKGRGGILLVDGPAGIGKTRLLGEADKWAHRSGARVLQARGSELEHEFAFGVVRQLFEPLLRSAGRDRRLALLRSTTEAARSALFDEPETAATFSGAAAMFGIFLSIYWLVTNLCEQAPLVLLLDDLQWADAVSQRAVSFLAGRMGGLSVAIVAALRPDDGPHLLLADLTEPPGTRVLRPGPLSVNAVGKLAEQMLGHPAAPLFVEACRRATGGVPFYAYELLRELARDGVAPVVENAARIGEIHPASVVRAVIRRIGGVSHDAMGVARAIAILGDTAAEPEVRELAGIDEERLTIVLRGLAYAGVVDIGTVRFAHPIIHSSLYEEIPPLDRAELHRRAAAVLRAAGGRAERVAAHLLRSRPAADPTVVALLQAAATEALARGGTTEAVALLARALAEPPAPDRHARVLFELGCAEQRTGDMVMSAQHLGAAVVGASDMPWWGEGVLALSQALFAMGQVDHALQLVDQAADELEERDPELSCRLRLAFLLYGRITISGPTDSVMGRLPALRRQVGTADTPAARLLSGMLCAARAMANERAEDVSRSACEAWGSGDLLAAEPADSLYYFPLVLALLWTAEHEFAQRAIQTLLFETRRCGSGVGMANARILSAFAALRQGSLSEAEADGIAAVALTSDHFLIGLPMAVGLAVESLVEQGDLGRAQELIAERPIPQGMAQLGLYDVYLAARGSLFMAQRRWADALADLRLTGRRLIEWGAPSPVLSPWRSRAAVAASALGHQAEAERLAREELAFAETCGYPHTRAVALRAAGVVLGGPEGRAMVEEAVGAVEDGPFVLEAARCNASLGQALRREGRLRPARERLRHSLELAMRCGASPIAELARAELIVAGGRPRRWEVSGVGALTGTERRVCSLAAAGLSNREIAEELFVVVKTVEVHLTASYRKLGIASRGALKDLPL